MSTAYDFMDESIEDEDRAPETEPTEAEGTAEAEEIGAESESTGKSTKTRRKRAVRRSPSRGDVKNARATARSAVKVLRAIEAADAAEIAFVAHLLSTEDDEETLVAAIVAPGAADPISVLDDIDEIAGQDDRDERLTTYFGLDEIHTKRLWDALRHLGAVEGNLPSSPIHAAFSVADGVGLLGAESSAARALLEVA